MPASYCQPSCPVEGQSCWVGECPTTTPKTTADVLAWADLHGVDSHGISMIPGYDGLRRSGRAKMDARPKIIRETPVSAVVDGGGGLGHVRAISP